MTSLGDLQLEVLRLMRAATVARVMTWRQSEADNDWFYTESGPVQSHIQFKWPSYNGAVGSDRDFVEVGGAGRFMIGTPGWALALEILAAGLEEWAGHVALLRQQYERQVQLLVGSLKQSAAEPGAAADRPRE